MDDIEERTATVENMFGNSGTPLKQTDRKLVGEGVLIKMCRKKPKQRQFFLFSDILVYGSIIIPKKKLGNQHIIELEDVEIRELEDNSLPFYGFCIKSPKKSFAMYATSSEEKEQWIGHLKGCIKECQSKRGSVSLSSAKSPVWIPDVMAPKCMHCRLTVFGLLSRRHHCRHCGIVVCSGCSNKRQLLLHQSQTPVRVCDRCYDLLQQRHENRSLRQRSATEGEQGSVTEAVIVNYLGFKDTVSDGSSGGYISETSSEDSDYDENQPINLLALTNPNLSVMLG